jgi:hypothetical protein
LALRKQPPLFVFLFLLFSYEKEKLEEPLSQEEEAKVVFFGILGPFGFDVLEHSGHKDCRAALSVEYSGEK